MSRTARRPPPTFLVVVACASGFAGLGYEVLYLRHLTTLLGDMLYVHAALLSTFLVGVGAGAFWAHRAWGRLWLLEMGTGLYALLLPWLTGVLSASPFLVRVNGSAAWTIGVTVGPMVDGATYDVSANTFRTWSDFAAAWSDPSIPRSPSSFWVNPLGA